MSKCTMIRDRWLAESIWHPTVSIRIAIGTGVLLLLTGCVSNGIHKAREQFYAGQLTEAKTALSNIEDAGKNQVLLLMERGMVNHASGDYPAAIGDWLNAINRIRELDYIRLSEKTTSMVLNDRVQTYTGRPYERALLHAFTAKSYFAMAQWREAAVEARLIADGFENLNGFPDDAYTRYVAGLAFECIRDFNGARLEYAQANRLAPTLQIDPNNGQLSPTNHPSAYRGAISAELICLIGIGQTPPYPARYTGTQNTRWGRSPYADIVANGKSLGRSYTLNTTGHLAAQTERRLAAIKAAKTVSRVVIKDSIADAVGENNVLLGEILRLFLFALEMPDTRQWQTLPNWLQVARVPLPAGVDTVDVVFRNAAGAALRRRTLSIRALTHSEKKHIAILRVW
jgi:tetratricopeptide (TPR) repeat protein